MTPEKMAQMVKDLIEQMVKDLIDNPDALTRMLANMATEAVEMRDEIERLQARVDALETWVSVKDRMPEPGQRVIIFGKRSYQPKGFMRVTLIDGYGAWSGERYPEGHNEVTHWMDVPEPPK